MSHSSARRLSQQDAFFIAYQQESAVSMQLGAELEFAGELRAGELETLLEGLVECWPHLGQTVHRRALGLSWQGPVDTAGMSVVGANGPSLRRWRNVAIDPFRERPLQLRWIPRAGGGTLALRAHHSALDGHSLMVVADFVLHRLARGDLHNPQPDERATGTDTQAPRDRPGRSGRLGEMWRYLRWLKRESKHGRSARLAVKNTAPGDIGIHTLRLDGHSRALLRRRARRLGVGISWLCSAAWIRTLGAWNLERGEDNALISIEVPVSTRRSRRSAAAQLGNGISPLVLSARADQTLAGIARDLEKQFVRGVRQRSHLAVPFFTAAGAYLPWGLFRRLATDTAFSGFATSHFTWMRLPCDLVDEVRRLSGGRFELLRFEAYGPVCLHMGAALLAIETPAGVQFSIVHRMNAVPQTDAGALAARFEAELGVERESTMGEWATR